MKVFTKLWATLMLLLVAGVANAATEYVVDQKFTSIAGLDGQAFAIVNEAESKAVFGSGAQNLGYDAITTAVTGSSNTGYYFKLEASTVEGAYLLRLQTPAGEPYNIWGNPGYLNSGASGGFDGCFILGLNNQNGQDVENGAVWEIEYDAEKGFALKNKARGGYFAGPNPAPTATDPIYWTFCTLKAGAELPDPEPVEIPEPEAPLADGELIPDFFSICDAGAIPYGYDVKFGSEDRAYPNTYSGGARMFNFAEGGDFTKGIYYREGYVRYGNMKKLTLTAGKKYIIHFNSAMWKDSGATLVFSIFKEGELETAVLSQTINNAPNVNGSQEAVTGSTLSEIEFTPEADGNYILEWNAEGWKEVLLANVGVRVAASEEPTPEPIYIETDLTAQFSALTDVGKWTGATGYTATNFCPAVEINGIGSKQVCEKYEGNCNSTGDIFYQTVTGLTPGTYKIELYGGAAFTFGRGFTSEAFADEFLFSAGEHIDENTGVFLYAETSVSKYEKEIPIYYATNFPDGAATVVLEGVVVGENGEVKLGMNKTSKSTNWHVVQLKGVSAQVNAIELHTSTLASAKAALEDADNAVITGAEHRALKLAIGEYGQVEQTREALTAAIAALTTVTNDFKAALGAYKAFADAKAVADINVLPYASSEKKDAVVAAANTEAATAAEATEKAAALQKAYRAYIESSALLEGLNGAVVKTDVIVNPTAAEAIADPWTLVLGEGSGGALNILNGEPWTDGEGNSTHAYFDGGNWGASAWDVALQQEISLPAGKYQLTAKARASADVALTLFAGETVATAQSIGASGGIFDRGWNDVSVEFELAEDGNITIGVRGVTEKQYNWMSFSDFRLVQFPAEPAPATHTWDFTQWSAATVANLKADAAASKTEGWSDVEKQADADAGNDPTETSKDNCFWAAKTMVPTEEGELLANGQAIEELKGLKFLGTALTTRNLAIAVNYPKALSDYNGGAYLWLGGADKDYFIIPSVKPGTTITMGVESHKTSDPRGVRLYISNDGAKGVQLKDKDGNEVAMPTTFVEQTWLVPENAGTCDIIVNNSNGCHIYYIDATQTDETIEPVIEELNYTVNEVIDGTPVRTTEGKAQKDVTVKVPYRQYNVKDGKLYQKGATSKEFNYSFTLAADNQVENIEYAATDIENVVFLSEGEDLAGVTVINEGNAAIRSSNSAAGKVSADADVELVKLAAGVYKITAILYDSAKAPESTLTFVAGENELALNCTKTNVDVQTTEEISLAAETTITIAKGATAALDLVYIVKTGEYVKPVPVIEDGVYDLTQDMFKKWESHQATEGEVIGCAYELNVSSGLPYGDGNVFWLNYADLTGYDKLVVLTSEGAARFCFNRTEDNAQDTDDPATTQFIDIPNKQWGTDAYETVDEGNTRFTIDLKKMTEERGFAHLHCIKGANWANVTVTAMKLIKGNVDLPTGISTLKATAEKGDFFNLNGQKVSNPTKGLYIVNGKKVFVK